MTPTFQRRRCWQPVGLRFARNDDAGVRPGSISRSMPARLCLIRWRQRLPARPPCCGYWPGCCRPKPGASRPRPGHGTERPGADPRPRLPGSSAGAEGRSGAALETTLEFLLPRLQGRTPRCQSWRCRECGSSVWTANQARAWPASSRPDRRNGCQLARIWLSSIAPVWLLVRAAYAGISSTGRHRAGQSHGPWTHLREGESAALVTTHGDLRRLPPVRTRELVNESRPA